MVHYKTCIQFLIAVVRVLRFKSQELQWPHQNLSQGVAAVAGISQSYADGMTQIVSVQAKQETLLRDYE